MYNPFHNIPSSTEASMKAKAADINSKRPAKARYHVNNPLYHRFPVIHRIQEAFLWKFYQRLPILDHVPTRVHTWFGLLYIAILAGIFIYLFNKGYNSAKSSYYLSPLEGDGASQNCELIPATNTGQYYATTTGHWEGNAGFTYADAAYRLTLASFSADISFYDGVFTEVFKFMSMLGMYARYQDLGKNVLFWMGTSFSTDETNAQRLNLVGTPSQVLNRQFHRASLGAYNQTCGAESTTSFDTNTAMLTVQFDITDYSSSEYHCDTIMKPETFGYDYVSQPQDFKLNLDMRTLISVVGINNGVVRLYYLVRVPAMDKTIQLNSGSIQLNAYYDPKYAGMSPIFCVASSVNPICIIEIGGVPAIPFFHHAGESVDYPSRCNCFTLNPVDLQDRMHPCHAFRFISGFYFWPGSTTIAPLIEVLSRYSSTSAFHDAGFDAAFIASSFGRQSNNSMLQDPEFLKQSFSFCNSPTYGNCSIFSIASFDLYDRGFTISDYYFQLERGACRDSFTPNATAWNMLIENIFAPLYQQYQKCHDDRRTILINQAGITIGNLQIVGPFCVLVILLLGYFYRYVFFKADEQETYENLCNLHYSKTEKQKALEAFAIALLIQRDRIIVDRFNGIDDPQTYDEDPDSATLRKLVANVVDHYNNPETRSKVIEFLAVAKQSSMQKVTPKSEGATPSNGEGGGSPGNVTPANIDVATSGLNGSNSDKYHGRERDVEIAYERLSTNDGLVNNTGIEMPDAVPRPLEEDNEFASNP